MNPSARTSLRLLGGFALERDARPCKLAYEKGRALLAYLAAEPGRTHSRANLAAMFWPELAGEAALTNLRQVLRDLRQALNAGEHAAPLLQIDRDSLQLDPAAGLEIDAAEFALPAAACPAPPEPSRCAPCLARMETLAARYRGEFMAEFSLPECPDFEEWLQLQREALHLRALGLLARLAECHERLGVPARALPFALRFLELAPWNEEALRRVMALFALNGQHATALAHYETSCRALKRELGVLPSEETQALAARVRRGEPPLAPRPVDHPAPAAALPLGERRQVTVLYCELAAAGVEDPDAALALLRAPQPRCKEIIRAHSGYLVQVHGGGLLAYFGYPQASENAARLAVRTALALTGLACAGLELRVGVHTGMVISGGDQDIPDAIGATSELAIHLRHLAKSGEVMVSAATQHLVAGYFAAQSRGVRQPPGSARPLEVFRIERESGAAHRLEAAARLTPLAGRRDESASLRALWQDARRGVRRIVLLQGEAGIGKSRLVRTLQDALREHAGTVRELRCFPEHCQSPFHPLAAVLGSALGFAPGDTPAAKFDKLAAHVETHYPKTERDAVPLLAKLLALPLRAPYRELQASSQQQRERTLAIVLERLHALAARQPLLLVVEDLHWADPSTLEILKRFVAQDRPAAILAVFTARPEFQPPWPEQRILRLPLQALSDADTATLIAAVAPRIAATTLRRIVEHADGVPLFAEELAREAAIHDRAVIPATLQDLLAARLDALGAAKSAAQAAAAIGREFSVDLLRRAVPCDEATLTRRLGQLHDAGLLREAAVGILQFRHALIRDAAYQSQTREEREAAHRRIAAALQTADAAPRPELLAQHWAAGGEIRTAVACWLAAGQLAGQHSACQEAVSHFESGLALVEALPLDDERARLTLDLLIGLGAAACAAQGYASAQGAAAYTRAMALCGRHESGPEMFRSVWGLWASASSRAGYASALKLARQLLRMAGHSGTPVQRQQGHFALADTLYWQGEFVTAREHLERVGMLYRPAHHAGHVAGFGEDAGVTSGAYRSWVLWFLGFPEQARQASAHTLALARRLGHPYSLAYALAFAAILHCRLRQPEAALALAQETLALAEQHGFPLWQIGATLARGWALAMQNREEGVESLRQCVAATRAAMGGVTLAVLEPLADACLALGQHDAALAVADEALAAGKVLGDHHIEAELHRLRGEALLGQSAANQAQAATCFRKALAVSRRQQAQSLELRAALSLARLWQTQGRRDAARALLETVLRGFSEGYGTPDLEDARQLLDSLAG